MILPDFKDRQEDWVVQVHNNGSSIWTTSGSTWHNMRRRCLVGGPIHTNSPSYVGCEMSETFKVFNLFVDWSINQVGYGEQKYNLDKDILKRCNKIYSEDTCVFVPKPLNMFLCGTEKRRGLLKTGVYFDKSRNKFQAKIQLVDSHKHLGRFNTEEEAHQAYIIAKENEAKRWAKRLKDGEYLVDERVIFALEDWKFHE